VSFVLVTRHKVDDYAKWKSEFDGNTAMRKDAGEKSYKIFQTDNDTNDLVILFEWDNLDNARKFMQSNELREKMKKAGVISEPDKYFLKEVERGSM